MDEEMMRALEADGEKLEQLWKANVRPDEVSHIKNKIVDFVQDNDPFGDRISEHDLRILEWALSDLTASQALFRYQNRDALAVPNGER